MKLLVLSLGLLCPFSLSAWQSAPTVAGILERLQANVAQYEAALPDFVANERVDSRKVTAGRTERQRVTESVFTCIRLKGSQNAGDVRLSESREVIAVDGKPVKKGQKLKGPSIFGGAVGSILNGTFGRKNVAFQHYSLEGEEALGGRLALVIAFATNEGQTGLAISFQGKRVVTEDHGKAWLDPDSLHVLRLERTFSGLPHSNEVTVTVDYSEVNIDGRVLLMPKTVTSLITQPDSPATGVYTAEYSNYRKFSVSTGITYN